MTLLLTISAKLSQVSAQNHHLQKANFPNESNLSFMAV